MSIFDPRLPNSKYKSGTSSTAKFSNASSRTVAPHVRPSVWIVRIIHRENRLNICLFIGHFLWTYSIFKHETPASVMTGLLSWTIGIRFTAASTPAQGPTQSPVQWISLVNVPGCEWSWPVAKSKSLLQPVYWAHLGVESLLWDHYDI
jgi:hypothetical protein